MAIDLRALGQLSLLEYGVWRTTVTIEPNHRLVVLCQSMKWEELMEKVIPILYEDHGISPNIGPDLDLRGHLGAYILQAVHGWTDRWTEEMLRYYIPARIFCGYLESTGSLDHTRIEDFRNRLGEKGALLITSDVVRVAKNFGFTKGDDVDMDTTVQEAGITHPTEMKLMNYLRKKVEKISEELKKGCGKGISGIKSLSKKFKEVMTNYRFFAKTKQAKTEAILSAKKISEEFLERLSKVLPETKGFESLKKRYQLDILRLLELGPQLMEQIEYWLKTGKVAKDKIISLWKWVPQAIKKGKIGNPVEFGRKWIINCYQNGYVLVRAPQYPKFPDQHCVLESLSLHSEQFTKMPKSFGTDRGMSSAENLEICLSAEIEQIAIQPKGKAKALVSQRDLQKFSNRRAGIEPRIAHLKARGLGRSRMKSDAGDLIGGYRSALSYNLSLLMRDLSFQPAVVTWRQ